MRKQTRPEVPEMLVLHSQRWTEQWVSLRQRNPAATFNWYPVDALTVRQWVLPDLHKMTQGHCAFCDTYPLDDRSKTPIEHFRPKTHPEFLHLADEWSNLYYCCDLCQATKREQWDHVLLCPDANDYSFDRYFMFDFTNGRLLPNEIASENDQRRAEVTIRLYGLDLPEPTAAGTSLAQSSEPHD